MGICELWAKFLSQAERERELLRLWLLILLYFARKSTMAETGRMKKVQLITGYSRLSGST